MAFGVVAFRHGADITFNSDRFTRTCVIGCAIFADHLFQHMLDGGAPGTCTPLQPLQVFGFDFDFNDAGFHFGWLFKACVCRWGWCDWCIFTRRG